MFSKVHGSEFDVKKLDLIISPFKFKSSTISGSTQLHNSNGILSNTNDFIDWDGVNEIFNSVSN